MQTELGQTINSDVVQEVVRRLGLLSTSSEDEFLRIGQELQSCWEAAASLTDLGTQASDILSGSEMIQSIEQLSHLAARSGKFLEISGDQLVDRIETVGQLRRDVDRAAFLLDDMKKMVLELRMLGASTRIESARLDSDIKDFTILADEVTRQSGHIKTKSSEIKHGLVSLQSMIGETTARLNALNEKRKGQGNSILERLSTTLEILNQVRSASKRSAQTISDDTRKISQSMSEAVMSIQFHDITRQQIEHVVEALQSLDSGLDFDRQSDLCRLQAAQLLNARSELVTAVGGIIKNLTEIAAILLGLSGDSDGGLNGNEVRIDDFVVTVEAHLSVAASSLDEYHGAAEDLESALKAIAGTLESMAGFAHEVEEISQTIRLVALNAGIQATGLGRNGSVFSTIAQAIKELSIEAKRLTDTLADALEGVTNTAKDLLENKGNASENTIRKAEELRSELDNQVAMAREITSEASRCRSELFAGSRSLADRIEQSAASITIHEQMAKELDEAMGLLKKVAGTRTTGGDVNQDVNGGAFEDLSHRYTMEAERKIHQSILRGDIDHQTGKTEGLAENMDDLGDNIELF